MERGEETITAAQERFIALNQSCTSRESGSLRISFSEEITERLKLEAQAALRRSLAINQPSSSFARSLELVDDLFVATDYAYKQYGKNQQKLGSDGAISEQHQRLSQTNLQKIEKPSRSSQDIQSALTKRDKNELNDLTQEDALSQPSKKAKKQPFQSAKDKFKQEVN